VPTPGEKACLPDHNRVDEEARSRLIVPARRTFTGRPKFSPIESLGSLPPDTPPFRQQSVAAKAVIRVRGAIIAGEGVPGSGRDREAPQRADWLDRVGSVSVDWWATALAGVIVALAVADVLPKIPW